MSQETYGIVWESLGRIAYDKYCAYNIPNMIRPKWEDLAKQAQEMWIAVAQEICHYYSIAVSN